MYAGGQYSPGIKPIKPGQTVAIDFKELRDSHTPDPFGNTIPISAETGQIAWSVQGAENKVLSARSEQISLANGVASTYSCANCCPNTVQNVFIDPTNAIVEVGETATFSATQTERSCNNIVYGPYYSEGVVWDTLNSGIATAKEYGELLGVSPGVTSIRGSLDYPEWIDMGNYCADQTRNIKRTALSEIQPGVGEIQYKGPNNPAFTTISSTLYILKDTTVQFKALPNPANGTFVEGRPVWEGSAGATGSGDTKSITFDVVSASTTDFKTVVVTSGNSSKTVNVVVFDLTGALNPQVYFNGRSMTSYGLKESVNLGFLVSPSISASQMGGLTWKIAYGQGSLNNTTTGSDTFTSHSSAGSVTLKLDVQNGPSKNLGPNYTRQVVAPTGATMALSPENSSISHCQGSSSVGFYGEVRLLPKDVSFSNLTFREGGGIADANGFYSSEDNRNHQSTAFMTQVTDCNASTGCKAFVDEVWTGSRPPDPILGFYFGELTWPIQWLYALNLDTDPAFNGQTFFVTATHYQQSNNVGTASIQKHGAGPFSRAVGDPDQDCR